MNIFPSDVQKLIGCLQKIPGLGPKSAARIAMFMLKSPSSFTVELGGIIRDLKSKVVYCEECCNIASESPCKICSDPGRNQHLLCIVEDILDVWAFEKSTDFNGLYHVLGGVVSPVNGVGPEDLTIDKLIRRIKRGQFKEVVISTNPNIEGEATAMYIRDQIGKLKIDGLKVSCLARGLPSGADLEYVDKTTIRRAFEGRTGF